MFRFYVSLPEGNGWSAINSRDYPSKKDIFGFYKDPGAGLGGRVYQVNLGTSWLVNLPPPNVPPPEIRA